MARRDEDNVVHRRSASQGGRNRSYGAGRPQLESASDASVSPRQRVSQPSPRPRQVAGTSRDRQPVSRTGSQGSTQRKRQPSSSASRELHYGQSEDASQYSREKYTQGKHSRKSVSTPEVKHKKSRRRGKIVAIVVVAILLIVGGVAGFYFMRPISITVDGAKRTVAFNTTYSKLHDDGVLSASNGNLVAVDGSVLQTGKGGPFKAYDNGELVANNNSRVQRDSNITESTGDDVTENCSITEKTEPWTWDIEDCGRQDTYNFSIGMWVTNGTDGVDKVETGSISGKTAVAADSQKMVPRMVRHYFTNKTGGQKTIALTFDDGPSQYTQQVLDTLSKYGAVGTFYEVGNNIQQYPEQSKAVIAQGSEIGNHSLTHNNYYNAGNADVVKSEVTQTNQIIKDTTGETCTDIRPPGGFWSDSLWKTLDGQCTLCVGWSIDTEDWKKPGVDSIVNTALEQAEAGDVVLMHDGGGDRSQSVAALDTICSTLKQRGFTFVTVSQMAQTERDTLVAAGTIPQG